MFVQPGAGEHNIYPRRQARDWPRLGQIKFASALGQTQNVQLQPTRSVALPRRRHDSHDISSSADLFPAIYGQGDEFILKQKRQSLIRSSYEDQEESDRTRALSLCLW